MTPSTKQLKLPMNDGHHIPQLGLGVFQATDGDEIKAVVHALTHGYSHIDTAAAYRNEAGVGQGIAQSGVPRGDVFLTTKVWNEDIRNGTVRQAIDQSLETLKTDYVDLMLLHWPVDGRVAAWQALIDARDKGQVRSIGVSNFLPGHLNELIEDSHVTPAVNQIEFHPYLRQSAIADACRQHGILVEAWSPLMQGHFKDEPAFTSVAATHGKTAAQVILRWAIQHGVVVIPKSVTPSRIEQNAALFDFELSAAEMSQLDALEREKRFGPNPASFNF